MNDEKLIAMLRAAKADGWDEAVAAMVYTDGTKVELASNVNPYRRQQ